MNSLVDTMRYAAAISGILTLIPMAYALYATSALRCRHPGVVANSIVALLVSWAFSVAFLTAFEWWLILTEPSADARALVFAGWVLSFHIGTWVLLAVFIAIQRGKL